MFLFCYRWELARNRELPMPKHPLSWLPFKEGNEYKVSTELFWNCWHGVGNTTHPKEPGESDQGFVLKSKGQSEGWQELELEVMGEGMGHSTAGQGPWRQEHMPEPHWVDWRQNLDICKDWLLLTVCAHVCFFSDYNNKSYSMWKMWNRKIEKKQPIIKSYHNNNIT